MDITSDAVLQSEPQKTIRPCSDVRNVFGFPTSANQLHPLLDGANGVKQDFFGLT